MPISEQPGTAGVLRGVDGRLRAGWRMAAFLFLFASASAAMTLALRAIVGRSPRDAAVASALRGVVVASVATIVVAICCRLVDKRPLTALGLRRGRAFTADLVVGFVISGALLFALFGGEVLLGYIRPHALNLDSATLVRLPLWLIGAGLATAWWEELVFRGYLFQNLVDGLGQTMAIAFSVLLYGAVHMANPNASLLSAVLITLIGWWRIYARVRTGQLWLGMGMHAGWNFFQGPILGFAVSGRSSSSLIVQRTEGPSWLTGGAFGPEGGVLTLPFIAAGLLLTILYTRNRRSAPQRDNAGLNQPVTTS